jgi:arginase
MTDIKPEGLELTMTKSPNFTIIDAPSILGLWPSGVEMLPVALKSAGLIQRLNAQYGGKVPPLPFSETRDPENLIRNGEAIRVYAQHLADVINPLVQEEAFPIVLGGDCSILIGAMLGLRRISHYGLFFIDGHSDFYNAEAEPHGEVASMELAILTGRGPGILTQIEGLQPLVADRDVVVFGFRDIEDAAAAGSQDIRDTSIRAYDVNQVRQPDVERVAKEALQYLEDNDVQGFWIHLDADVLNDDIMPAVDYRIPDGLTYDELSAVLKLLIGSGKAVGMTITIYNPMLDQDGSIAQNFVESIVKGFA